MTTPSLSWPGVRETPAEVFHGRVAELDLLADALREESLKV